MEYQTRNIVLADIYRERERQNAKWGIQRHDFPTWYVILGEEIGEVAQAIQSEKGWSKVTDKSNLYEEIIHSAAVLVAMAEQIKEGE